MASQTYSFLSAQAELVGPNGRVSLGNGAGAAEEGITIAQTEDRDTMTIGADGSGMHSLHAGKSGQVTVRLLKTSPTNAILMAIANADFASPADHGQNTILIRDVQRGDAVACSFCAFRRVPDLSYAKVGNTVEWTFNSVSIDYILGTGTPAAVF